LPNLRRADFSRRCDNRRIQPPDLRVLGEVDDFHGRPDEGLRHRSGRVVNVKNALDTTIALMAGGLKSGGRENRRPRRHARSGGCIRRLSAAAGEVGTPQIRNAGTVGGNLNQRPRAVFPC